MSPVEKFENTSHWTVEYTIRVEYDNRPGQFYNSNRSTEVIAADIHRALKIFTDEYPGATVHVIRKTSRWRTMLVDRPDDER